MHPLLLPGTHLLRRGDGHLQLGLREAAVVPRAPAGLPELVTDARVAPALLRRGLVAADDGPLRAALPPESSQSPWPRHTLAAVGRRAGGRLADVLATRAALRVEAHSFGHPLGGLLAEQLTDLCSRTALATDGAADRRRRRDQTVVTVLVGVGEPRRELTDGWMRDGRPHLVVRLAEGVALLGPLVEPGRTACLRCTDAYSTEEDPSWPLLVEQYARASSTDRADGIPEPVDAALASLAVAWAVRDLATYAEGGTPTTWSSTVGISADLGVIETRTWEPHPSCGCSWG